MLGHKSGFIAAGYVLVLGLLAGGCGGAGNATAVPGASATGQPAVSGTSWPSALPQDAVQPWERLDAAGRVIPRSAGRMAASINVNSIFVAGVERYLDSGDVTDYGEASTLHSGSKGARSLSTALYRLSLGAEQPGVVAADANLRLQNGSTALSGYYLGLSDYGHGRWEWHGPFTDSHVRLSTGAAVRAGADYTSALGDLFIYVVAYDGAELDVIGIGENHFTAADVAAPPAPGGLTATPVGQGLFLQWNDVIAGDLAGYRVYYRQAAFTDPHSPGVLQVDYIEGSTRHVLMLPKQVSYNVAVAALDLSGNESALSPLAAGIPLSNAAPILQVTVDTASVMRGDPANLAATGAESYDFDLDGDGAFDLTNTTGLASVNTTATGLIRPRVRGTTGGGSCQELGGVSLIVTGNTRPAVSAVAAPQHGAAPLSVSFTGSAEDLEDPPASLSYAWDFNGDGTYEASTNSLTPAPYIYKAEGIYNCRFRATDSSGAWAAATVAVQVTPGLDPAYTEVYSGDTNYPYTTIVGGFLAVVFQAVSDTNIYYMRAQHQDALTWSAPILVATESGGIGPPTMEIISGNPAVCWTDTANNLKFARAANPQGSVWNAPVPVLISPPLFLNTKLIDAGGNPAIVYIDSSTSYPSIIRATDSSGTAWGAAAPVVSTACDSMLDATTVGGNPALVYSITGGNRVDYILATNAQGTAWNPAVVVMDPVAPYSLSLAVLGGIPCIAITDHSANTLYYSRAKDADGSDWNYAVPAVYRFQSSLWADNVMMQEFNGRPTMVFTDTYQGSLFYCEAVDFAGNFWQQPWTIVPLAPGDYTYGPIGYFNLGGVADITHINHQAALPHYQIRVSRFYR